MTRKCTIVCPTDSRGAVVSFASARGFAPRHDQSPTAWKTLECGESLKLTSFVYGAPMDEFSKTVLGMHAYFGGTSRAVEAPEREAHLKRIAATEMFIGVVIAESSPDLEDFVFDLVKHLGGCVFDGSRLLDGDGEVLIEREKA